MVWAAVATALTMAAAVIVERTAFGVQQALNRRLTQRYRPLVQRAIEGDETARGELLASPARHRLALAWLLIEPLIEDRDPERIARTRAIAEALSVFHLADRYLRSWLWWRRALALRALGLVQARDHTAQLVAALDDSHPDVRAAALDGADGHARPGGAAGHRRAAARHLPAPRPARRGAQGVRIRLRAVPAGVVGGRSGKPPQLHPRPGHLWHGPVAARLVPLDSRRPHRGTRDGI